MAKQMSAVEVMTEIEKAAETGAVTEVRDGRGMKIGQGGRQGDIYVFRVAADWPRGKRIADRQMAVGNTQGSRHIAAGNVEVYEGKAAPEFIKFQDNNGAALDPLLGPCIVVRSGDFAGEHPEHAHFVLDPGTYQVVHQMDARSLQRVQD